MSNLFKKSNIPKNNQENKQNDQKNFLIDKKEMNPNTIIITKAKRKINLNNENNIKPIIKEQEEQKLNSNKKTKNTFRGSNTSKKKAEMNPKTGPLIINKSTKKPMHKNNIFLKNNLNLNYDNNFVKDENNEVNTYLKNKSLNKHIKRKYKYKCIKFWSRSK